MKVTATNLLAAACFAAALFAAGCSRDVPRETKTADSVVTQSGARSIAPASQTKYVGLQYDSMPRDFKYQSGSVLPAGPAYRGAEYDLAHVTTPNGDMVWLDTLGARLSGGLRAKIVRAELMIPPLQNDERLLMASCDVNGKLDPEVVAIVVNEAGATRLTKIRQAWRVSIPNSRFEVIPVAGVVCDDR